jgi:hypothetical protein
MPLLLCHFHVEQTQETSQLMNAAKHKGQS